MKKYITRHIIPLCLLFLLLASCNRQEDTPQQADGMVNLTISAAMVSRVSLDDENSSDDKYDDEYRELMHTLRIIIFDEDKKLEHDRQYTLTGENDKGLFETRYYSFIVKGNETKTIYLLANCEDILKDQEISKSNLDNLELTTDNGWFSTKSKDTNFHLPATAKYEIEVGDKNQTETLYVAHAANKISITYHNELQPEEAITIHSWTLEQVAQNSYLIPHITDDEWYEKVLAQYKGESNAQPVTGYNVPPDANHTAYTYTYAKPVTVNKGTPVTTPAESETPIYLHESKNIPEPDSPNDQGYTISFRISEENGTAEESKVYTAELENLPSLFRGTYVQINVTINALEEGAGPDGIFAEIEAWKEYDPTTGTIVPEEETTN